MFSNQSAVSDGTLSTLAISLDYWDRSEINVYINGVYTTAWTWTTPTSSVIQFNAGPLANGTEVLVRRTTDISAVRHYFSGGAQFTYKTLDEDLLQILHIAQESIEGGFLTDLYNNLNMRTNRITNLGNAVASGDAVNLGQVKGVIQNSPDVQRTVRAPLTDAVIPAMPAAAARANKMLTFDAVGNPTATMPVAGSATALAIDLADSVDPLKGASLVGYDGGTVRDALDELGRFDRIDVMVRRMRSGLPIKVVCFGDSITWGQLDTAGVQANTPYPARLQNLLQQFYTNGGITVVNAGVPGDTTQAMLSRIQTDVLDQNPDIVIFNGGTNDAREANGVQLDTFRSNIDAILDILGDIPTVVMGITPRFKEHATANGEGQIDYYRKTLRDIAVGRGHRYVDIFKMLHSIYKSRGYSAGQVSADGSHYSEVGYVLIGDAVFISAFSNDDLTIRPGDYKDARGQWIITQAAQSRWGLGSSLDANTLVLTSGVRLYLYVEEYVECALVIHATLDNTNGLGQNIKVTHQGLTGATQTYSTSPKLAGATAWFANGWPIVTVKLKPGLNNILLESDTSARIDGFSVLATGSTFTSEPLWGATGVDSAGAFFGDSLYKTSTQFWESLRSGITVVSNSGNFVEPYFKIVPTADAKTSRWRWRGMFPSNSKMYFGQRVGPSMRNGYVYRLDLTGTDAVLLVRDQTGVFLPAATVPLVVAGAGTDLKFDMRSTASGWSLWINDTLIYTDTVPMALSPVFLENNSAIARISLNPPIKKSGNSTDFGGLTAETWFTFVDDKLWITTAANTTKSLTFT